MLFSVLCCSSAVWLSNGLVICSASCHLQDFLYDASVIWDAWGGGVKRLCVCGTNLYSNMIVNIILWRKWLY